MRDFSGKLAVITGGGAGMGRELARQLIAEGCDIAFCDVMEKNMAETVRICMDEAPQGVKITSHICDIADEDAILAFRDEVALEHDTDHIHLLFNNAGVSGGGSFINATREDWDRTFNICWGGVYHCTRAFMPLLLKAEEAHLINTSSVNGFWASLGPQVAHTAYSSAKFAVKGFTEALINDLRLNAPHVKVSLVMPGHIGTSIAENSGQIVTGVETDDMGPDQLARIRQQLKNVGMDGDSLSDDDLKAGIKERGRAFRENAPMSAAEAATIILDGVRQERWRILVGRDAHIMDDLVRADPEEAYEQTFMDILNEKAGWGLGD